MTKQSLLTLILSNPAADSDDKSFAKKLAKTHKHTAPRLALVNIARRVTRQATSLIG